MCFLWLPGEVWTLVFGYLSFSDRLRVRATSKFFRDVVDNSALWKDWTVELKGDDYEEDFWASLRRWRVTSLRTSSPHNWSQIAEELPGLTSLTINNRDFPDVLDFRSFTNLERLCLTYLSNPLDLEEFSVFLPLGLEHLTVCHDMFESNTLPATIPAHSLLKQLKSLTFHSFFDSHPVEVLHFLLSSLPQLQHLSLSVFTFSRFEGRISELPPLHNSSLSSLKLVDCDLKTLPTDVMQMLRLFSGLRSLTILCLYSLYNDTADDHSQKLSAWLKDLPALTSLVMEGVDVGKFVRSIPSSVTRLTLVPLGINSEEMTALSEQLPDLRHLHLESLKDFLGSDMALIPRLFPRLRTLRVRFKSRFPGSTDTHEQVPEEAFLSLASLKELQVLEMLDSEPLPTALITKLRALTNHRVSIYNKDEDFFCLNYEKYL